jgi:hypothetical protein
MIVGLLLAAAAAAWVYTDAQALAGRGLRVGGTKWKPFGWALWTFLFLIVFLPLYLVQRGRVLRSAVDGRFCTQCGETLPAGAAFCPRCGSSVGAARTGPSA